MPSLVLGPFGCGKTRTLNECIKLLASHVTEARILICTHSNSAANLYVESLHREWNGMCGWCVMCECGWCVMCVCVCVYVCDTLVKEG